MVYQTLSNPATVMCKRSTVCLRFGPRFTKQSLKGNVFLSAIFSSLYTEKNYKKLLFLNKVIENVLKFLPKEIVKKCDS